MDRTTEDSREKDAFSAVVMNEAVAQPIRADSRIVVQTPIKLAGDSAAVVDGDGRIDALSVMNNATVQRIRGFGNIVIQIPIFIVDTFDFSRLETEQMSSFSITNMAAVGPIEGTGNIVIQMPVLIVDDVYYEYDSAENEASASGGNLPYSSIIENIARKSVVRGERNVVIQAPVQLTPEARQLLNSSNVV